MLRHWRLKAAVQAALSMIPRGDRANYWLQRYVMKSYPVSDSELEADRRIARRHLKSFEEFGHVPRDQARCYEFGAGWDLAIPLILAAEGVAAQTVADIAALAKDELVSDIARRCSLSAAGLSDLPQLGIQYLAPVDVSDTGLPPASCDLITSTNTLEHIPARDIPPLLAECARLLAPGGVCSFRIDYGDHYHYFDPKVSQFNFLRYSDRRWRLYNPRLHFQNRLRHSDYLNLFEQAGLSVRSEHLWRPSESQAMWLTDHELAPPWRILPWEALSATGAHVVLQST